MPPKTSPTDNLRHWNALGRTDPEHTKGFQRAGGFKGTAIKPIWTERRMTEHFGPCGVGWGMDAPVFQLVPAGEELMVYCTARLWYVDPVSERNGTVYGVGGDKVIVKQARGLVSDDEAFKKAFTDALGNAMKHIGVAADVHMGLFDDSKYVQQTRKDFAEGAPEAAAEPADAQLMERASQAAQRGSFSLRGFWERLGASEKKMLKPLLDSHLKPIAEAADKANEQNPEDGPPARSPADAPPEEANASPNAASPPGSANQLEDTKALIRAVAPHL